MKYIIEDMDLIHSVDSIKLATEIDRHAARVNKVQDILIEVNVGGEASKAASHRISWKNCCTRQDSCLTYTCVD